MVGLVLGPQQQLLLQLEPVEPYHLHPSQFRLHQLRVIPEISMRVSGYHDKVLTRSAPVLFVILL